MVYNDKEENIAILPFNTLRVTDMILKLELEKTVNKKVDDDKFTNQLIKVIYRPEKRMNKLYGINDKLYDDFIKLASPLMYELGPKTDYYNYFLMLQNKKYCNSLVALFDNEEIKDDTFKNAYYDGTIDGLEKYITDSHITALILDDVELVKTIIARNNVNLEKFSFIISEMGFNLERGTRKLKYYDEIRNPEKYEISMLKLFNFK